MTSHTSLPIVVLAILVLLQFDDEDWEVYGPSLSP